MFVKLSRIVQSINLESGLISNSLIIELPTGEEAALAIDEQNLEVIIRAHQAGAYEPVPSNPQPVVTPQQPVHKDSANAASKDLDEVVTSVPPSLGGATAHLPSPAGQAATLPQAALNGRRVEMDEWGYPRIVNRTDVMDPGEVVGEGGNVDEDGVPSL
jgi:hypothetical protein